MDLLLNPEVWVAFLTLVALEIVLGIDNIVFISIIVDKLPEHRQALARRLGLGMALLMRILLLLSLSWVIGLTAPLFTVLGQEISGRVFAPRMRVKTGRTGRFGCFVGSRFGHLRGFSDSFFTEF